MGSKNDAIHTKITINLNNELAFRSIGATNALFTCSARSGFVISSSSLSRYFRKAGVYSNTISFSLEKSLFDKAWI